MNILNFKKFSLKESLEVNNEEDFKRKVKKKELISLLEYQKKYDINIDFILLSPLIDDVNINYSSSHKYLFYVEKNLIIFSIQQKAIIPISILVQFYVDVMKIII